MASGLNPVNVGVAMAMGALLRVCGV
jgi:hypothetical protein